MNVLHLLLASSTMAFAGCVHLPCRLAYCRGSGAGGQRDNAGAAQGPAIELGTLTSVHLPTLTLASDGSAYLACWETQSQISCATVTVNEGAASKALSAFGVNPSLAFSSGTFALAYGVAGHLAVQRISCKWGADGAPALFDAGEEAQPRAFLAATKLGFVLAGGDDVRVHRLSSDLVPIGDPIDLGAKLWMRSAIAAPR